MIVPHDFDMPLECKNCDKHAADKQGEVFLNLCKNSRLRILNGHTKGDRSGNFTRYPLSFRESLSTLDYVATDTSLLLKINSFVTLHHLGISDHECLSISIKTKGFYAQDVPETPIIKNEQFKYSTTDEQ